MTDTDKQIKAIISILEELVEILAVMDGGINPDIGFKLIVASEELEKLRLEND